MEAEALPLCCREENHEQQLKDDLTYIKKPPNAFMLFLEEQRPLVAPELRRQGTSKVNKALGKKVRLEKPFPHATRETDVCFRFCQRKLDCVGILQSGSELAFSSCLYAYLTTCVLLPRPQWKSLTVQEKAKYFHQARITALRHKQLYPGWNNSKNYVRPPRTLKQHRWSQMEGPSFL